MEKKLVFEVLSPSGEHLCYAPNLDLAMQRERRFIVVGMVEYCIIKKVWF